MKKFVIKKRNIPESIKMIKKALINVGKFIRVTSNPPIDAPINAPIPLSMLWQVTHIALLSGVTASQMKFEAARVKAPQPRPKRSCGTSAR